MRASEEQRRRIEADIETMQRRSRPTQRGADRHHRQGAGHRAPNRAPPTPGWRPLADTETRCASRSTTGAAVIADVLAVLQRMGRNPPPAILVRPQDMAQAIRAAMLLGAVVPDSEAETDALAHDLDELANLRKSIADEQRTISPSARPGLAVDKQRLTRGSGRGAPAIAGRRRTGAGRRARPRRRSRAPGRHSQRFDRPHGSRDRSGKAAPPPIRTQRRSGGGRRQEPRRSGASARSRAAEAGARLRRRQGHARSAGGRRRSSKLSARPTRSAARRRASRSPRRPPPRSPRRSTARIVFSGPYRTYGQLLIINAGGGYYMVLAGMDRINVGVGQFVLAGEPVARWATVRRGRRPPPLLAPRSPFSISNFEKTERQSIRGRGGRRRTSKRHADDAQGFLFGSGRGDRRCGASRRAPRRLRC